MNQELELINNSEFFKPTVHEVVKYNHLDVLFPSSENKYDEYKYKLPEDQYWHPYDWGHRNGHIFKKHSLEFASSPISKSRVNEEYSRHYDQRNLQYPRSEILRMKNADYPKKLNRWREVGDLWLIKSEITDNGYAVVLITGIKEQFGNRYIEFCLADTNLKFATDLDIYIQAEVHSNMSYDVVVYEDLEGSLFEEDKRFLHRIGRVHSKVMMDFNIDKTALFKRGNPIFSESNKRFKHRQIKEFEASILSKEVVNWLSTGEVNFERNEFDIKIVKGLSALEKRHKKLNKGNSIDFNEIKTPYINHLWKLSSTYKDNLIIETDKELEEEKELVFVNKTDNSEASVGVNFYNEDL